VIDDTNMNALFDLKAKRFIDSDKVFGLLLALFALSSCWLTP